MFLKVSLQTNEYLRSDGSVRTVDQIELRGYDMTLRSDITSDRDIYLARRMAYEQGVEFYDNRKAREAA